MTDTPSPDIDPVALEAAEDELNGVIGWLAALAYPGVGTQMARVQRAVTALEHLSALPKAAKAEGVTEAQISQAYSDADFLTGASTLHIGAWSDRMEGAATLLRTIASALSQPGARKP